MNFRLIIVLISCFVNTQSIIIQIIGSFNFSKAKITKIGQTTMLIKFVPTIKSIQKPNREFFGIMHGISSNSEQIYNFNDESDIKTMISEIENGNFSKIDWYCMDSV